MKKICSLIFLFLVMASVSQGAQSPQRPGEDDSAAGSPGTTTQGSGEERWDNFGEDRHAGGLGENVAPDPVVPPARVATPLPPEDVGDNFWGDAFQAAAGWLGFGADAPGDGLGVHGQQDGAAEVAEAAPIQVLEPPPVVLDHLPEDIRLAPAGPAGEVPMLTNGDVYAAEAVYLANRWADCEYNGRPLFPNGVGMMADLELTEPLLRMAGLSRVLVEWRVLNLELDIVPNNLRGFLFGPWDRVPTNLCGFTLRAPNGFTLTCIASPQPTTVRELALDMMPLMGGDDLENSLVRARNRLQEIYHVGNGRALTGQELTDMGLPAVSMSPEENHDCRAKVVRRIEWIRAFIDRTRSQAVAGTLSAGSLLMAINQGTPYVYGFNTLAGVPLNDFEFNAEERGPDRAQHRLFRRQQQLLPAHDGALILPEMPVPEDLAVQLVQALPAEDWGLAWILGGVDLYGAFTGLFGDLFNWGWLFGDWNLLAFLGYGPVPADDTNVVALTSAQILEDMRISLMRRQIQLLYRDQQQPAQEAARAAAAHAAAAADQATGLVWK